MARRKTNPLPEVIFDLTGTTLETVQAPQAVGGDVAFAAVERAASQPTSTPTTERGRNCLYLDLETAPDESRGGPFGVEFGLDDVRSLPPVTPQENLLDPVEFLSQDLAAIRKWLISHNPPERWVDQLIESERASAKPRKGLFEAVDEWQRWVFELANEEAERRKLLSVTPEYCRIVAMGWAVGGAEPSALVCNEETGERQILAKFWELAARHAPIVGFNVSAFDLTVIRVRSVLLGIRPTRCFADLKPWDQSSVVDLMVNRFPKSKAMKLKDLARLYGIDVPAGDADGGDVYEMVRTNPEALRRYVTSDVLVTRELHRKWIGTFCVQ